MCFYEGGWGSVNGSLYFCGRGLWICALSLTGRGRVFLRSLQMVHPIKYGSHYYFCFFRSRITGVLPWTANYGALGSGSLYEWQTERVPGLKEKEKVGPRKNEIENERRRGREGVRQPAWQCMKRSGGRCRAGQRKCQSLESCLDPRPSETPHNLMPAPPPHY